MAGKYIVGALAGSFVVAFTCDYIIADKKIFGGKLSSFDGFLPSINLYFFFYQLVNDKC